MADSSSDKTSGKATARKRLPKDDKDYAAMPFDSVLRTVQQNLRRLIILLMNRIFDTDFTGNERIEPAATEMMLLKSDGSRVRRGVDAHFTIVDSAGNRYIFHIECQTNPDGSIVMRFAEYDLQLALEARTTEMDGTLDLYLPNSVLLNLRGSSAPRQIRIHKDDQTLIQEIKVQNMTDLTAADLFAQDTLALLPFWIFTHSGRLTDLGIDPAEEEGLIEEFRYICSRLNKIEEEKRIDTFEHSVLLELIRRATHNAVPGSRLEKEVKEMADANIFELETVRFYNEVKNETEENMLSANIRRMLGLGKDPEDISLSLDVPLDRIKEERCKMDEAVNS